MERRTDKTLTAQELVEAVHYQPLHWPGKTVRLERESIADYRQRPGSVNVSIAELYHENSKLTSYHRQELAAARTDVEAFRREFARRLQTADRPVVPELPLDAVWRELLSAVSAAVGPALFYAVELRLAHNDGLGVHEPTSGRVHLIKRLSSVEREALRRALLVLAPPSVAAGDGALLFVLGRFARNDLLYGARGYRRTLLEAGQVTEEVVRHAARLGLTARPCFEFADRAIDGVLEADGTEEGTLAVVEVGGSGDVSQG